MDPLGRFIEMARRHGSRPAVIEGDKTTLYSELLGWAAGFAARFNVRPAGPPPRVLVALPAGAAAYAAMLGAGLAGGLYTPVNTAAPEAKIMAIAAAVQPDFIVAQGTLAAALAGLLPAAMVLGPAVPPAALPAVSRHDLAYVMFTSGSTGTPKGVCVSRAALGHFVDWIAHRIAPGITDRWAQYGNIGFDISVTEIYGALCFGGLLLPVTTRADRLLPARLIRTQRVTIWNSVPSLVALMMRSGDVTAAHLASLRLMNFCGEPLLPEHLRAIFAARPELMVQNTYGPTEATVSMTALTLRPESFEALCKPSAALGAPVPGMGLHLIGGAHEDEGEIVITGPQLAAGYWENAAQTAAAFRPVMLAGQPQRGYFTGDWAERINGEIYFRTRTDFQVKIHGHRVELDEIAAAIRSCGWPVVLVVKHGETLAAIIEAVPGQGFDEDAVLANLRARLESHAVPTLFRIIPTMPRNDNDKLDVKAVSRLLD